MTYMEQELLNKVLDQEIEIEELWQKIYNRRPFHLTGEEASIRIQKYYRKNDLDKTIPIYTLSPEELEWVNEFCRKTKGEQNE